MLRQFAWKNQIFSSICLAISRKFAWKNRFDFFTRIHDPQISNQIDSAASWKVTYPRIVHRRVIEKQYFARVSTFYLSIYGIYIAPLQGNYSEALPAQSRTKRTITKTITTFMGNICLTWCGCIYIFYHKWLNNDQAQ